jgi:hypothetical protein
VSPGTDLEGSGRKRLTGVGGSMAVQTERQGATVVERRSSRGCRQGGRGNSRHRCQTWGADGVFRKWPEWWSMVAQQWQAQQCSGGKRVEEEEGTPQGSAPLYRR